MKISIIGYTGAGKSTLAKKLKDIYDIEVMHLDRVNFIANWKERNLNEAEEIVNNFMQKDNWIIEGNYQKLKQDKRFELSDKIIFLNFPVHVCLPRAFSRFWQNRGRVRDDAGENCNEKFDLSFFWWIVYEGRTKTYKDRYQAIINKYQDKTIILNNQREVDEYLANLKRGKLANL